MNCTKTKEQLRPVPEKKIKKLIETIVRAPELTDFARKILILMIASSEKLTKPLHVKFCSEKDLGREVSYGVHDLCSSNGSTHINNLMKKIKSPLVFSTGGGDGIYTVWLAPNYFDKQTYHLDLNIELAKALKICSCLSVY